MFSAVALTVGLAACGGGGLSTDAYADLSEMKKPAVPGNSLNAKAGSTTTDAIVTTASTQTTTTTEPVLLAAAPAFAPLPSGAFANVLRIGNPTTQALSNYPLQFGRAFRSGEVAQCPQVYFKGTALETQTDVKNRHGDGSLRFAVVSVMIPSLASGESADLELRPASCGSNTALTRDQMLADFNFDASVILNAGGAGNVSARNMMLAGKYRLWTSGPIVTTAIIEDHTTKSFDMGTDANKSLRPLFHVQFWPKTGAYRVRYIVEQADTTKLQNQTYSVRLTAASASPVTLYEKAVVDHIYASRWTKDYWLNRVVPQLSIQHNVGYLASTYAIPNYDSRVTLAASSKAALLNLWAGSARDIYDPGLWQKAMWAPGGRPEIGLFPSWHIFALYDGDAELWKLVRQQSDLAAAWPSHFRSGDARTFDTVTGAAGLGRVVTRDTHPSQHLNQSNGYMNVYWVAPADRFSIVGAKSSGEWAIDGAHQPDPWYLMYLTTGEWWYLEELMFSASWGLFEAHPDYGPNPRWTFIASQPRGDAWLLRTRARAGYAAVDGGPEKAYFTRATEQALRAFEGKFIGTGADPIRAYWATDANSWGRITNNPLRFWEKGVSPGSGMPLDSLYVTSPWMQSFLLMSLGHVRELGFGAGQIFSWLAVFHTGMVVDAGSSGQGLAEYNVPATKVGGALFQDWRDVFDGFSGLTPFSTADLEHGYATMAIAAVSFATGEPNGVAAWNWVNQNGYSLTDYSPNPKWAIMPR